LKLAGGEKVVMCFRWWAVLIRNTRVTYDNVDWKAECKDGQSNALPRVYLTRTSTPPPASSRPIVRRLFKAKLHALWYACNAL